MDHVPDHPDDDDDQVLVQIKSRVRAIYNTKIDCWGVGQPLTTCAISTQ